MKIKLLIFFAIAAMIFSSCKKTETPAPTPVVSTPINWNDSVNLVVKITSIGVDSYINGFNIVHDSAGLIVPMYPNYNVVLKSGDSIKFSFRIKRNTYWQNGLGIAQGPTSNLKYQYTLNNIIQKDTMITTSPLDMVPPMAEFIFRKNSGNTDKTCKSILIL